ncbi:MAG TPA: di-heme oxidoredictase family protein [Thermoanaerobaculia bacterium]|nr:di-heme oxidoredictase family protein [Thermoanaerobaculia bacterium]
MKRLLLVLVLLLSFPLAAQRRRATDPAPQPPPPPTTPPPITPPPPPTTPPQAGQTGAPLANLSQASLALFNAGRQEFASVETVDDGLGPVFNGRSCGECHGVPALGGGSNRSVTRIGAIVNGAYDQLANLGGSLLQVNGIGPQEGVQHRFRGEVVPQSATIVARRRSTPLFGLGLVDATDDTTFVALAQFQAARNDGTAGRVALVENIIAGMKTVGKFGWKAQVPTLEQFSGDAYLNEMGITNPLFPNENCPQGNCAELQFNPRPGLNDGGEDVAAIANFMRFLGAPSRGAITSDVTAGEAVFSRIGCDSCHQPLLQTAANANPALDHVTYAPYSDFLLHDMGSLGDGIVQGDAGARELRTAPLWGLRFVNLYLHDGRANTMEAAITAHDGQGRAARDRFTALNPADRIRLLAFLRSL